MILRMNILFFVVCVLLSHDPGYNILSSAFTRVNRPHYKSLSKQFGSTLVLFAKKKKTLVSDDFLSSFDDDVNSSSSPTTEDVNINSNILTIETKQKKKKKQKESINIEPLINEVSDASELEEEYHSTPSINPNETIEQRMRREKPPSRVKFSESSQPNFVMMALENVGLAVGNAEILKNVSFSVVSGERVGLVGPNGSGKTTQLKILAGDIEPTTGTVIKSSPTLRVSFLRQEFLDSLNPRNTLREELHSAFVEELDLLNKIKECEDSIGNTGTEYNADKMTALLDKLQELQEKAIAKGVYSIDSKIEKIMDQMGFSTVDADALIPTFSGGWKMRVGLAKILLQDPNVVLLDEPTNHLDLESVFWLEDFLKKQTIPLVVVSHDREFLDRVCNKIVDIEDGYTVSYDGNYSKFLEQRLVRLEQWKDKYEKQMRYVKEEEKVIKKAKGDPTQSQLYSSKFAALEKFKASPDWVKAPPKDRRFRFRFPPSPRCGQSMIEIKDLKHGYNTSANGLLFENVNMRIDRGDRIGFVGPNGAGKSTLMKIIVGKEDPLKGYCDFASNNIAVNYFEQSTADTLNLNQTVFESVQDIAPLGFTATEIRSLLGQFMFKGDDADKLISCLSGGEKARVSLCRMMLQPSNLLLLDEPTNHLDISSKEVLEEALQHYDGAVVVISHDRYFMSQVAKQIYSFQNQTVIRYDCDYHDFMNNDSSLKEKIESRYVTGDSYKISNAKDVIVEEEVKSKKNFGGSGVTCGNLNKGIKNAKRYSN